MTDIGCQQNLHPFYSDEARASKLLLKKFDSKFDMKQTCSEFQRFHFFHDGSKVVENLVKSIKSLFGSHELDLLGSAL